MSLTRILLMGISLLAGTACADSAGSAREDAFTRITFAAGKAPNSIECGDFNNDGWPDLVVANAEDSSVSVFLNTGHGDLTVSQGGFRAAPGSPYAANRNPNDIGIADFNKDGNADLGIANTEISELTVLLGNGKGAFGPAPHSPIPVHSRPHTHGIAIGDYNSDGWLDMAADDWGNNKILVVFGDSAMRFGNETHYHVGRRPYQRLRSADLNHDGRPDIVTTNLEGNNSTVLLCNGDGSFHEPPGSPFPCGNAPFAVAIGDVNGDGQPDLAIADAPTVTAKSAGRDGLFVLLGDGKGNFHPLAGSPFATGKSPTRVAIGDLNGDGISDIAVTNYNGKSITIFYMSKSGIAGTATVLVGNRPDGICIADFNKDGKEDLAVTNHTDGTVTILFGK